MRKRNSKSRRQKKDAVNPPKAKSNGQQEIHGGEEENQLNFGGLPDRNLKKNLGCG